MNFADQQRKNYWNRINNLNSESTLNKSIPDNNSNLKSRKSKRTYYKNRNTNKKNSFSNKPKKHSYQKPNHFVKRYKIIPKDSWDIKVSAIINGYYDYENDDKNDLKDKTHNKPQYNYQKESDELKQINNLIDRISKADFYDEEKDYLEKEFDEVQKNVKNVKQDYVIKRNEQLKSRYSHYLDTFYEIRLREYASKLNDMYDDTKKLSFNDFENKYSGFFDDLCSKNIFELMDNLLKKDADFSNNLKDILDYFIQNKSPNLIKRYNALIRKIKKSVYKNQKVIDDIVQEHDIIIPQLHSINILSSYFNFKKINFKKINVNAIINKTNARIMKQEYEKNKEFFNNFMGEKLDQDQIDIILSDEDNTKIIAGAGSGKTFTLQAKLKYLLDYKGVNQDKILCISFSNAAVDDLKRKIDETIGEDNDVDVLTYHSFGGKILKRNKKNYIPNENLLNETIYDYFERYVLLDENKMKRIIDFFNLYNYTINIGKIKNLKLVKKGDFYEIDGTEEFDTLKDKVNDSVSVYDILDGEKVSMNRDHVRSYEELMIANFLYINNIDYVYEPNYFKMNDIDDEEEFTQYRPDFYLPDKKIYIEHFGVDRNLNAKWLKNESERKKYKQSIIWKRDIHKKYNTKLIETYSYFNTEGILLDKLKYKLEKDGVKFEKIDYKRIYERLITNKKLDYLNPVIRIIKKFILLFKDMSLNIDDDGNDCSGESFEKIYEKIELHEDKLTKTRNKFLLDIIKDIYEVYNSKEDIDFADMINNPIKLLKNDCKIKDYDYIFVDEYQDTSFNKYRLLNEFKKRTNAKLVVIGDDWQSIYGFNGCKIELFTRFEDYFNHTKIFKIQNTYRNSQELIDLSSKFIKRNMFQIPKELNSNKVLPHNPIKLTKVSNVKKKTLIFENIIDEILYKYPDGEILILGRYNEDFKEILVPNLFVCEDEFRYKKVLEEKGYLKIDYLLNKNVNIEFRTIHKAKGLQKDNVIIVGLRHGMENGFPSQYSDDSLIKYILKRPDEKIGFAEERRLFYVALTRTKNNVYLIADKKDPSTFVEELLYIDKEDSIELRKYKFSIEETNRMESYYNSPQSYSRKSSYPTKLNCKRCGGRIVLYKKPNGKGVFKCEDCHFDYGRFNLSPNLLDSLTFCNKKECNGLNYINRNRKGTFKNCTMYYKTRCNPKY